MVADNGGAVDKEALLRDAMHMRVISKEYAGSSMVNLVNQVGSLASASLGGAGDRATDTHVSNALALADSVRVAAEVAAASIRVCGDEGLELASDTARVEAMVAREDVEVQRLRRQLERETRVVQQRDQLDAAARLVLKLPAPRDLAKQIDAERAAAAAAAEEIARVDMAKSAVAREMALLLQCAGSAGEQAKHIEALLADADRAGEPAAADAGTRPVKMDTSN